jgi:hypothetical protein
MVMLTRGWAKFLVLVSFVLELFGAVVSLAAAEDDEPAESEQPSAVHRQPVQQAPPPVSMPIPHRQFQAWPQEETYFHPSWMPRRNTLVTILTQYGTTPPVVRDTNARVTNS